MTLKPVYDSSSKKRGDKPLDRAKALVGALMMAIFIFVSRILGFFRDLNTAAIMGMSGSVAMDAFVCAFRIPNLARRFFEEGACGLSYIPVFSELWKTDRTRAWRLAAFFLWRGGLIGLGVTVIGESAILLTSLILAPSEGSLWNIFLQFAALMFPYLTFILPTAQCAATLQGMGRFSLAGMMPTLFNLFWLAALLLISPFGIYLPFRLFVDFPSIFGVDFSALSPTGRGSVLSGTIVAASAAQFFIQYGWLKRLGADAFVFRGDAVTAEVGRELRNKVRKIFKKMIPTAIGLLFLQFNTLLATLTATLFSGNRVPLLSAIPGVDALFAGTTRTGAASALYFGERLYEFPLAFIGVTIGTAFYPLLVRHALEKNRQEFATDMTLGLRLIVTMAIPAGIGLALVSGPLARLLYMRGEFSPDDAFRTARIVFLFGIGVPAFCLSSLLIRGMLALGNGRSPIRIGAASTLLFLLVALGTVRPAGEAGLAAAIVVAAWFQTISLFFLTVGDFTKRELRSVTRTLRISLTASVLMTLAILGVDRILSIYLPDLWRRGDSFGAFFSVSVIVIVGVSIFSLAFFLLGGRETGDLWRAFRKKN